MPTSDVIRLKVVLTSDDVIRLTFVLTSNLCSLVI